MRVGLKALSNSITSTSDVLNATWPFFVPPHFETQASDIITQTRIELISMANYVDHQDRGAFESFTTANYEEWVREAHMVRYGNLDLLKPFGFSPNISQFEFTGNSQRPKKVKAPARDKYLPYVAYSPPTVTYVGMVSRLFAFFFWIHRYFLNKRQYRTWMCSPMVELWMYLI